MIDNKNNQNSTAKSYLVNVGGKTEVWDEATYTELKDALYSKYPDANMFEMDNMTDFSAVDDEMQYVVNTGDRTETWDAATMKELGSSLKKKYPNATVQSLKYKDYWYDKALADEEKINAMKPQLDSLEEQLSMPRFRDASKPDSLKLQYDELKAEYDALQSAYDSNPRVIAYNEEMAAAQAEAEKRLPVELRNQTESALGEISAIGMGLKQPFEYGEKTEPIIKGVGEDGKLIIDKEQFQKNLGNVKKNTTVTPGMYAERTAQFTREYSDYKAASSFLDAYDYLKNNKSSVAQGAWYNLNESASQFANEQVHDVLAKLESKCGNLNEVTPEDIDNNLSQSEKVLLQSYFLAMGEEAKVSKAFRGGEIAGESFKIAAEMIVYDLALNALLPGAGTAAGAGSKAARISSAIAKWYNSGSKLTKLGKGVLKLAGSTAKMGLKATGFTALAPTTYSHIAKKKLTIGDDGKLKDSDEDIMRYFAEDVVENFTELSGEGVLKLFGKAGDLAKGTRVGAKIADRMDSSWFGKAGKWLATNSGTKWFKRAGFHGLPVEVFEEFEGAVINQFTGLDENAISNFADKDNLTTMMIGFAPMTLLGMGTGIGSYAYASHSVDKNAKNLSKVLLDNGYNEEQVKHLLNYERQMSPEALGKEINNVLAVMEQNGASAEAKKAVTDYAVAVGRYKAMEGAFKEQQPELKNKKLKELNSKYGTFYQTKNDGKNKLDEVTTTYVLPQGETKGRDVFIVSEKNDSGQYDAIDVNTGERLKVSDSDVALLRNEDSSPVFFTRSLDTYLTERVMEERKKTLSDYEAAYGNGQEMSVADLSSLNEQEQQAKDNLLNTGITSRENSFTEDSINLSSSELLSLSEQEEFTEEESNAIRELAIAKRTNEGLIDKIKQPIISSIDSRNSIASNASNNGTLTVGSHNGKTVYVKGGVQTSNGSIVKPDNAKGYPVEIVDAATGEVSVVDSKEVTNAGNVNTATWNRSYEVGMIKAFEQKIEELRNAKSPNAILSEVYELVGKKVYLNINDNIILVEVDQILPSMEVLIKGKKGDLGGKSVLAVGIDEFYNMIYRDANGNPVLPKEEQEESEVTDYRGETVSILINGVPASVEVVSQDNSSDSIVYEYTDEGGNTKRGRSTISEFGKAIEQANEYVTEQPNVPEEASVAETQEQPIEEAPSEEVATEEPVEAPVENIPLDPESINWDELFEQDKEAYFIEMQNQFGEEAVDVLNEEIDAAQSELDALGKAKTKSQNDRIKNRNKKKALQSRIDALNEMVARLTTPAEAPVVEEVTETVEEAPVAQETEATVEVPAEEALVTPEQPSAPVADTPAEPAAEPAAPVAPNPVADPVSEAKNREERLLSLIERKGVSDALKRDSAFNAGKEVADFFATYAEFEEYEAEAKDLGNYYEDFARGVKASFTNRPSNEPHIEEAGLEVSSEKQELALDAVLESLDNNIEVEAVSDQQAQAMLDVKAELSGIEAMTVYHGSPHKFSAFDHSKMGTGEGAQAHGWGTYVAVNRQTSEEYADVLRGRRIKITRNGFDISGNVKLLPMDAKTPLELIATLIDWHGIDKAKVELERGLKEAEQKYKESSFINSEYRRAKVEMYKNASVLLNSGSWKVEQSLTNLYTVNIPEDSGSNYFGERELTDRQMEMISDACEREGVDFLEVAAISSALSDKREGARLYKALSEVLGSPKDASEFLSRAGFTGIKYTGNVDGDCFVIFNESDAEITGHVEFYQTPNGTVYGWTDGKKIYLTKAGFNPNTPIHEYTHLWAKAMMQKNAKGWNSVKSLLKGTPIWDDVINDPNYSDIKDNEDSVASEALSRLSGSQNASKMEQMAQQMIDEAKGTMRKAKARGLIQNMKDALAKFWNWVGTNLFKIEKFNTIDEVTDRVLWDLLNKTDLGIQANGSPFINAAGQNIEFNIKTESTLEKQIRDFAKTKEGKKAGWTDAKVDAIINETQDLINAIHVSSTGNEFYDEFAKKDPTIRVDWRDGVDKPIVTWTRANIEYKYDMSADLLCINNESLEKVLSSDKMVALMEMFVPEKSAKKEEPEIKFTADDYLELYNTLRDLGFVVPCKGCFDAAGRFKMLPSVAQKFAAEVNAIIDERNKDPKAFDEKLKAKTGKRTANGLPATASTKSAAIAVGVAGDNLTEHIKWTQLMSADGQTKMLSDWGGIFRAWQRTGAGRPKDKLLPEPYYGDIVSQKTTIIGAYGDKTPSFRDILVNTGTGLRRNSHSEFRPALAVDEIQFMREAFIRNLTVFKYMKELDDVRLFGNMGVKFNMSFFPEFVPGSKVAGLDQNGDYIASEESVGSREFSYIGEDGRKHYDGMKGFEEAKKHINKDVSLSSVIFSIPHLIKALTDVPTPSNRSGIWGSLIPFHSSGATSSSLEAQGLGKARANGVGHGFDEAFTDYDKGVTNFEAVQNDRFGEGWYIVSGKKAGTNVEAGHKLEFANGTHYYNRNLGVHLFASGYILDSELPNGALKDNGELSITDDQKKTLMHKFTIDYNDKVRELGGPHAYKDAADYYISELPKIGLIPRFDFVVSEEKFLEMCEAANVDPLHHKLGWKGEGHSWSPIDSEAYYSLFCDYGMTDPSTGEWAPHMPVGYINEKGEREFRLPDNAVQIVKEGLERFSDVRRSENAKIDNAIAEFAKRSVEKGRISQKDVDKVLGNNIASAEENGDGLLFRSSDSPITPEMDAEYLAAVERGDMETAQRMVDEAADRYLNEMLLPNDEDEVGFKYHRGPAPTKTFKRYAVFNVSPGGFFAAYAGNKTPTPVGVYLDAQNLASYTSDMVQFDDGTFATYIAGDTGAATNTKFSPERAEELGVKGGQRWLLERGGKHSSDVPNFSQMNLKVNENGEKVSSAKDGALPHNKLIFEIEYGISEEGDLTDYVRENGRMMKGKNQGLAKIGPNQYYDFKTNPNAVGNWGIGGTFRITRLVPHSEIVSVTEQYKKDAIAEADRLYKSGEITKKDRDARAKSAESIQVQKWVGGYNPADFGLSEEVVKQMVEEGSKMKLTDPVTYDDNGNVIPLSERFNPEKKDIRYRKSDIQNAAADYLAGSERTKAIQRAVNKEAQKLGVTVTYKTRSEMPKGHENDKGYYNTKTGEIVICTENNASIADAIQTILHEAVAHKGLRQLMGDRFNEFINRVYNSLDAETKAKVDALATAHYNGNTAVAMEEYMASLAENENFAETSVWEKIKSIFESIINSILGRNDIKIGDKELRYILRASYNNMVNPNTMNTIEGWAKDTNMRNELGINEATPEILSRTGIDPNAVSQETAKQVYDRAVSEGWNEFQRQFQDAYQPVRIAIEAIQQETGNIPVEDYENYLLIQNQTSSRSRVEIDNFERKYYEPIIEQVNNIVDRILEARGMKNNKKNRAEVYAEVRQYMIAKHGLERNEYYQGHKTRPLNKEEREHARKNIEQDYADELARIASTSTYTGSERKAQEALAKQKFEEQLEGISSMVTFDVRDYSGLTSLFGLDPSEFEEAEMQAKEMVDKFERELGRVDDKTSGKIVKLSVEIEALWNKINAATDKTLRHSYESGMISRQQYDDIRSMFDFYIPLRGFDETTAEDVYSYARFEGNRFNAAVHKAEGRTSVADDPIATIMNMAESEIAQGNKNRAKQALYNFILNRPVMGENGMQKQNSLMQVEDVWYVKVVDSAGNEVYQIAAPGHEYGETYEEFEERMASLEAEEKAFKSKKGQVDVGKRFQKQRNQNAHYIYLKINGVDKAIYINGDPKAADAVNGTYQQKRQFGEDKFRQINRLISSTFTNYSLEFTARNFFRDMFYSHINMGVKEKDPAYRKTFRKNWRKNNMGTMLKMLKAYRAGEYDNKELNAIESAFVEFMENGGQTGYTLINSVESHKKELEKSLERMRKGSRKGGLKNSTVFKYTLGGIELLNEASELITRFAAFKTSRDMGRSVVESINDAKEITVNFNTKGAQDGTGWMGFIARYFGWSKYFFNASVQGVQNLKAMANANKLKFCGVVGGMMGLGFLMPVLTSAIASMLGGDDDEYWNIPEYDRQNNLCICIGGGDYIKIPLPIGFREVYAMGDMTAALAFDKKFSRDIWSVGMDYANKIASVILPINPLEGRANGLSFWNTFLSTALPSSFQFAIQNATNTDWKGAPLQKEYTWNEDDPQWMKAFENAPDWMVGLSKWCNENINLDGDYRGLDWSPEKLDNTLSNVFGGVYTLIKKTGKGISAAWNEEERNLSNVPLAGVVFGTGIESDGRFVTDAYFDMKEYYDANVNSIKRVASNFGLSLEDIFVKQKGAHHPKIQEIYSNKNFEWMKNWYLGHEGNRKGGSKEEKLGLNQLKQDIKDLQKSIAEREERGMSTEKKEEKLIEKQKMFDEYYRDFTYRLLEMD